ncbi:MAG: hypothetical protein HC802_10470 [Caldilineaceae bacterium]|nr:hypothetical protein [Caldilineaceae bacterium]
MTTGLMPRENDGASLIAPMLTSPSLESAAGNRAANACWRVSTMSPKAPRLSDQPARFFDIDSSER